MITSILDLRKLIKNLLTDYFPKDGWLPIYHKENTSEYEKNVRSYFAPSISIDWHQPFSDVSSYYNYPTVPIGESFARILIIEIEDSLTKTVSPELNQSIKIDMKLIEETHSNHTIVYKKATSDKSLVRIITKNGDNFSAKWLAINEACEANECLVLSFYILFHCSDEVLKNIKDNVLKVIEFPKSNLIYERTIRKNEKLVRIIGKKIFVKKNVEEIIKPIFSIGYNDDGTIKYFLMDKHINTPAFYYKTHVYFDRRVLTKYEQSQFFDVNAMELTCHSWKLQIFNNKINIISVLLPHLIRDLPEDEYKHWMAYNILPAPDDLGITQGEIDTSRKGVPHSPDRNDHRFKWYLKYYFENCSKKNITPIFKQLNPIDKPYFNTLNLISENSQWHFDLQILCLSKILLESVNASELGQRGIDNNGQLKNMLKAYLTSKVGKNDNFNYEDFLDNLYQMRLGAAHRRSSKEEKGYYDGIKYFKNKFGNDLINVLNGVFDESAALVNLITKIDGIETYEDLHKRTITNINKRNC